MGPRLVALVEKSEGSRERRHFTGLPPELTGGVDNRQELPPAQVLLIEEKTDGIFLFRFTEDGTFCGDTWHLSVDDAMAQAQDEYRAALGKWVDVPENIKDPIAFALGTVL